MMDTLAPGQQRMARLLLDDPSGTAFRSVTETAKAAGVHQSSVVRFATSLGLKGFPGLVALCRQQLAEEAQLVQRFGRAEAEAETGDLLAATLEHEQQNLRTTLSRIAPETWDATVRLLAEAERIHIMGLRKCLPVAQLMAYLLRMVRPGVHQLAPVAGALVDDLRDLHEGDVFVAISIDRYTAETVATFEAARARGLRCFAFTDSAASPLARIAETSFLVECEGVMILRSVTGFITLAQALATAVAVQAGTRSRDELVTDEQLLQQFHVYWDH
jgi:DNA-binding MurR/RpiR family transcriptional regulator